MKVLVLGAGGKTGELVVERALVAGHEVTAFVHDRTSRVDQRANVVVGDTEHASVVAAAVAGQDAVIDAIGGKTPYKKTELESKTARNVVDAMQANGVRRLLVVSMLGVGDSKNQAPFWYASILKPTFLRGADKDKARMESVVSGSGLEYVIVRPPILTDDDPKGSSMVIAEDAIGHSITRADLAQFLVDQLTCDDFLGQAIVVVNS
jgi:putative NADH-flavin reductase